MFVTPQLNGMDILHASSMISATCDMCEMANAGVVKCRSRMSLSRTELETAAFVEGCCGTGLARLEAYSPKVAALIVHCTRAATSGGRARHSG